MANELSCTHQILNFADPDSRLCPAELELTKTCIDALLVAKVGIGICYDSIKTAIHDVFISGEYGYSEIAAEMASMAPAGTQVDGWGSLNDSTRSAWLTERQNGYFQKMSLGVVGEHRNAANSSYDEVFASSLPDRMKSVGITDEYMLKKLMVLAESEDAKVAIGAMKMLTDMMGIGQMGGIQADRKKAENRARVSLAKRSVEKMRGDDGKGGGVHAAQEAAALEAYKMRMASKGESIE